MPNTLEPQEPYVPGVPAEVTPEEYAHAKATTPADIWESYAPHWDARLKETAGKTKAAREAQAVEAGSAPTELVIPEPAEADTADKKKK